jgi:hypothetical protein
MSVLPLLFHMLDTSHTIVFPCDSANSPVSDRIAIFSASNDRGPSIAFCYVIVESS